MQSTKLKVNGIDHVVLYVKEMDRSKEFYMDVLGFELRHEMTGSDQKMLFLRCGSQGLDLFESANADVHSGKELNHMALRIADGDLDEVVAELSKVGVETSERTRRGTVFISDPDGHRIEMLPLRAQRGELERDPARASL